MLYNTERKDTSQQNHQGSLDDEARITMSLERPSGIPVNEEEEETDEFNFMLGASNQSQQKFEQNRFQIRKGLKIFGTTKGSISLY
jgi:hypothetical protein